MAVYLFGSVAAQQALPSSDIDLAVLLTDGSARRGDDGRFALYADCSRALQRNDIDIVVLNTTRNLILLDEIVRNGVVVFEGDSEMREEFEVRVTHYCLDFMHQRLQTIGV